MSAGKYAVSDGAGEDECTALLEMTEVVTKDPSPLLKPTLQEKTNKWMEKYKGRGGV